MGFASLPCAETERCVKITDFITRIATLNIMSIINLTCHTDLLESNLINVFSIEYSAFRDNEKSTTTLNFFYSGKAVEHFISEGGGQTATDGEGQRRRGDLYRCRMAMELGKERD